MQRKGSNCTNGICCVTLAKDVDTVEFTDIGIQRVTKKLAERSLNDRRAQGIDPFNQGYSKSTYDKMSVKLCFQVFITNNKFKHM